MYPVRLYHEKHSDFVEWLSRYGPYFGNDDRLICLAECKFDIGVTSLKESIGLKLGC